MRPQQREHLLEKLPQLRFQVCGGGEDVRDGGVVFGVGDVAEGVLGFRGGFGSGVLAGVVLVSVSGVVRVGGGGVVAGFGTGIGGGVGVGVVVVVVVVMVVGFGFGFEGAAGGVAVAGAVLVSSVWAMRGEVVEGAGALLASAVPGLALLLAVAASRHG